MKILGGLGVSVLQCDLSNGCPKDKKIVIISDAHAEVPYCSNEDSQISNWLKNKMNNNYQILLEEVDRKGVKLEELWPGAKHTQNLKKLYLDNINSIVPIDIRPHLILFSWQILNNTNNKNNNYNNINLKTFIEKVDSLFNQNSNFYITSIKNLMLNVANKNSNILNHFNEIKNDFKNFKERNLKYMNENIKSIIQINKNILIDFDKFISRLMEWFIILKMFSSEKDTIIHTGLFHSREVLNNLISKYNFKMIYQNGVNNNIKESMENCFYLPKNVLNPKVKDIENVCTIL